ncbi:helix-turn-helix domain-containing protein [Pararobbsia silviterrae]|uniref:XRE family transcriptional regulator n=1 Tax=Pararobbsia silviterrae TaxID=1792498 RepID=A0A494XVY3_9BURK|nr:helix-turn-helix transcriptional regulator [Pararobbsia silviterrae]RKP51753.1 XRE family transcriptional regulator [Pararobbsia silviterrae]
MAPSRQEELVSRKIGKTIAKKRKAAGYTQEQVAEHLGIGNEAFSRIERGLVSPGIFKLYELAELFQCGVETFLIEGSGRPTDQAEHLQLLMSRLSGPDRQMIVGIVERLSARLGKEPRKSKSDADLSP